MAVNLAAHSRAVVGVDGGGAGARTGGVGLGANARGGYSGSELGGANASGTGLGGAGNARFSYRGTRLVGSGAGLVGARLRFSYRGTELIGFGLRLIRILFRLLALDLLPKLRSVVIRYSNPLLTIYSSNGSMLVA